MLLIFTDVSNVVYKCMNHKPDVSQIQYSDVSVLCPTDSCHLRQKRTGVYWAMGGELKHLYKSNTVKVGYSEVIGTSQFTLLYMQFLIFNEFVIILSIANMPYSCFFFTLLQKISSQKNELSDCNLNDLGGKNKFKQIFYLILLRNF